MSLTEDHACAAIMRESHRRNFCLPRYTPRDWWECDVFELTKSGYFREFEVKLTLADFKNDAQKSRDIRGTDRRVEVEPGRSWRWVCDQERKHDLLAKGDPRGPAEFWFVTPEGLIPRELLPAWAGLIELRDRGEGHRPTFRWMAIPRVEAPRLHKQKAEPEIRKDALGCCYYRLHTAMARVRDRSELPREWTDNPPPASEELQLTTP